MNNSIRLIFFAFFVAVAHAKSEEEIKQWFTQLAVDCNKENPISTEDMLMLNKHKLPEDKKNAKCLLACVYKKAKWMDDKGMFNIDLATATIAENEKYPARLENGKKVLEICKKVNDETVGDGANGCDRAELLFKCLIEYAPKMGFVLA